MFLFRGKQHVAARQPDIRSVAALLDRRVGERHRVVEVAEPRQRDPLGGEQLGVVRKSLQRLVGPQPGLAEFTEFDQHLHLARPGGGVLGIVFQHLRVRPERLLEVARLERRLRLLLIIRLVFDEWRGGRFFLGISTKLQIAESTHGSTCLRQNQR